MKTEEKKTNITKIYSVHKKKTGLRLKQNLHTLLYFLYNNMEKRFNKDSGYFTVYTVSSLVFSFLDFFRCFFFYSVEQQQRIEIFLHCATNTQKSKQIHSGR